MVMALSQETDHWWRVIIVYSTNGFSRFIRALCTLLHSHYNDFFEEEEVATTYGYSNTMVYFYDI